MLHFLVETSGTGTVTPYYSIQYFIVLTKLIRFSLHCAGILVVSSNHTHYTSCEQCWQLEQLRTIITVPVCHKYSTVF